MTLQFFATVAFLLMTAMIPLHIWAWIRQQKWRDEFFARMERERLRADLPDYKTD